MDQVLGRNMFFKFAALANQQQKQNGKKWPKITTRFMLFMEID
jgi:hypothetical protein